MKIETPAVLQSFPSRRLRVAHIKIMELTFNTLIRSIGPRLSCGGVASMTRTVRWVRRGGSQRGRDKDARPIRGPSAPTWRGRRPGRQRWPFYWRRKHLDITRSHAVRVLKDLNRLESREILAIQREPHTHETQCCTQPKPVLSTAPVLRVTRTWSSTPSMPSVASATTLTHSVRALRAHTLSLSRQPPVPHAPLRIV